MHIIVVRSLLGGSTELRCVGRPIGAAQCADEPLIRRLVIGKVIWALYVALDYQLVLSPLLLVFQRFQQPLLIVLLGRYTNEL